METKKIIRVIGTRSYQYMVNQLLDIEHEHVQFVPVDFEMDTFKDGENYHRLAVHHVEDQDVLLIGGTGSDVDIMELFDLGYGITSMGAGSLTILVPYYGYSTMERSVKPGEIVTAKSRALVLSAIPQGKVPNKIAFMDLHADGIPQYLEGNIRRLHIYTKDILIEEAVRRFGKDVVIGSTDAGRAKWVESIAREMGVDCALILKRRLSGSETLVTAINADVKGRIVLLYDDMIRTGGTAMKAADLYIENGAEEVHLLSPHGVLPGLTVGNLQNSKIKSVIVTNTHPQAESFRDSSWDRPATSSNFLTILPVFSQHGPLNVEQLLFSLHNCVRSELVQSVWRLKPRVEKLAKRYEIFQCNLLFPMIRGMNRWQVERFIASKEFTFNVDGKKITVSLDDVEVIRTG